MTTQSDTDTGEPDDRRTVIVDGSNVAFATEGEVGILDNIRLVTQKLEDEGLEPIVLVDAALRHKIDDPDHFEQMVDDGRIRQAPAGTDADFFILSFAKELDADIVSNDRFRDSSENFREERERTIRFMIVNGEVVFERRQKRRRH